MVAFVKQFVLLDSIRFGFQPIDYLFDVNKESIDIHIFFPPPVSFASRKLMEQGSLKSEG